MQRLQAALVERDVLADETTKYVEHNGAGYGGRRVEIIALLRSRPGKIDDGRSLIPVDSDFHVEGRAVIQSIAEFAIP